MRKSSVFNREERERERLASLTKERDLLAIFQETFLSGDPLNKTVYKQLFFSFFSQRRFREYSLHRRI